MPGIETAGTLYLALPDKRYTFDKPRKVTPLDHVVKDYREGPEGGRREHFRDWAAGVGRAGLSEAEVEREADRLTEINYSIHFHVWTQFEMVELIHWLRQKHGVDFDMELLCKLGEEFILVLRKNP